MGLEALVPTDCKAGRKARKDARLMMEQAERESAQLTIIPAIAGEMDRWIAKGHGNDDWTIIAKDNIG